MNPMTDLHASIMEQMRRLRDCDSEHLEEELQRSKAMTQMGGVVVDNLRVAAEVQRLSVEYGSSVRVPRLLPENE